MKGNLIFVLLIGLFLFFSVSCDNSSQGEDSILLLDKTAAQRDPDLCTEKCHAPGSFMDPIVRNGEGIQGKHKKHVGERGYDCQLCHNGYQNAETHRNGILDIPNPDVIVARFDPDRNPAGTWINDSGLDETGKKTGGCSNLYCHGEINEFEWYEDVHLICTDCHTPGSIIDPVTTSGKLGKGKHIRHVKDMGIDCQRCHENYPKQSSHANGFFGRSGIAAEKNHDVEILPETANFLYFGGEFRGKEVNAAFGTVDEGSCENIICHGGQGKVNWYLEMEGCHACHQPGSGGPLDPIALNGVGLDGKHDRHVERREFYCTKCHLGYNTKVTEVDGVKTITHMNGTFDADNPAVVLINFDDENPDGKWVDDEGTILGKKGGCTEICHPDAQNINGVDWYAEKNENFQCTNCHRTGSHLRHLKMINGPMISCGTGGYGCHGEERRVRNGTPGMWLQPNPDDPPQFADGEPLATTEICGNCHSSGGAFDGVNDPEIGAKNYWYEGIYENGGFTLKPGKEKWCSACHDKGFSLSRIDGIPPQIIQVSQATFEGSWGGSGDNDFRNSKTPGTGDKSAAYVAPITVTGEYDVYTRWQEQSPNTDATPTANYWINGNSVIVNQQINSLKWVKLGSYTFTAGDSVHIVAKDDSNGIISVGPIKLLGSIKSATYAPPVVGDNSTYGYWVTGHGKSIQNCLECHDASKKHFDHEHRTYEIDETTSIVQNSWGDSYRLRTSNSVANEQLCVKCHDQGAIRNEGEQSNFKALKAGHDLHVWSINFQTVADTDYDSIGDSRPICTTCHNPHGSKSNKMIRTGELASTPKTDDRKPGLNQTYVKTAPGPFSTATWRPNLPSSGTFTVYGWWKYNGGFTRTAEFIIYHNEGSTSVVRSQKNTGDQWVSLGTYNFSTGTSGYVELSARLSSSRLLADQIGFDIDSDGTPDIVIDDQDPEFSSIDVVNGGEWPWNSWASGRMINYNEAFVPAAGLAESTAGFVQFNATKLGDNKNLNLNNICKTCHGVIIYQRTPFMGPKVINRFEERRWVLNDGSGDADIVVSIVDPDGDMTGGNVTIDVSSFGGGSTEAMTDNGDGTFSYQLPIPMGTPDRSYTLPITATDWAGNVGTNNTSSIFVRSSVNNIYLDNIDVVHSFTDNWQRDTKNSFAYGGSYIVTWNHKNFTDESLLTATWESPIENTGDYKVYAWLFQSTIFNQNALYTIRHSEGTTPVSIDQRTGASGGAWKLLGTFNFDKGSTAAITLSGTGIGFPHKRLYVDAIKLEPVP